MKKRRKTQKTTKVFLISLFSLLFIMSLIFVKNVNKDRYENKLQDDYLYSKEYLEKSNKEIQKLAVDL